MSVWTLSPTTTTNSVWIVFRGVSRILWWFAEMVSQVGVCSCTKSNQLNKMFNLPSSSFQHIPSSGWPRRASHEGDESSPTICEGVSTSHESESSNSTVECSIGELQPLGVNLKQLSRDALCHLLKLSLIVILLPTHVNVLIYRVHSASFSLHGWISTPGYITADLLIGHSAEHVFYSLQTI